MSVLLADVVSVGSGVIRYHDRLLVVGVLMYFVGCGESYMLVLVDHFKHPLNAEPKLYEVLHPCWANPVLGVPRLVWAVLIAARFLLLVSFLAKLVRSSSARVMLLSRNRLPLSRSCQSICLMCCCWAFFCCLRCSRGSGGMMVLLSFICSAGLLML